MTLKRGCRVCKKKIEGVSIKYCGIECGSKVFPDLLYFEFREYPKHKYFLAGENGMVFSLKSGKFIRTTDYNKDDYYRVSWIEKSGKLEHKTVHSVVWEAFNGAIDAGKEINHKDGNKKNNALINLELVTSAENTRHAFENGLVPYGEDCAGAKLTEEQARFVLENKDTHTTTGLARMFNVSLSTIVDIKMRRTWKHIDGTTNYKKRCLKQRRNS